MNYRTLGKTGLRVSEVGYGAWGIGKSNWIGASDDESVRALNKAFDLGLNFIDTALGYGEGHSERLIGQAGAYNPNVSRSTHEVSRPLLTPDEAMRMKGARKNAQGMITEPGNMVIYVAG